MNTDNTRSPLLPGGDLVSALFDREVMGFADRGGASNLIGDRWADIAAGHVATWIGTEQRLHADDQEPLRIIRVDRLDHAGNRRRCLETRTAEPGLPADRSAR